MVLLSPPLLVYLIMGCFIASLTNIAKPGPAYLKLFSPFLLITGLVEYYCFLLVWNDKQNLQIYNMLSIFAFGFYLFVFYSIYKTAKAKRILLVSSLIYLVCGIINVAFIQQGHVFHTYTFIPGCMLIVIFGIYYFYQLFKFPELGSIFRDPAFWITTALLFYFCCTLPIFGILNYLTNIPQDISTSLLLIIRISNIILYGLFTIAFLCRITTGKPSS